MNVQTFIAGFQQFDKTAIVSQGEHFSYAWLSKKIAEYEATLQNQGISSGAIVQINADFSPYSVAMLFALANTNCIIVPMTNVVPAKQQEYQAIVGIEYVVTFHDAQFAIEPLQYRLQHDLVMRLRKENHPGLIIMSSGSSGKSKAIIHDFNNLLMNFREKKTAFRTISFLLFDHIGGFNTILCNLFSGGTLIIPEVRETDAVAKVVEAEKVEVLVTSPSFLNLLLLSQAHEKYDLHSLKIVNYGSEPMPESLLHRLNAAFPEVRFFQAYGLSEIGVLKAKSKASDSLFIKLDEDPERVRINDGMLEVKLENGMLGYLNAPSPYTEDGWFKTGDMVMEQDGYIKILGRKSDVINVGGEKVYPGEIENVLLKMEGIEDAVVSGEPNAILGNIVAVKVRVKSGFDPGEFKTKLIFFCRTQLPAYKIPQKIEFVEHTFHGQRFKKMRNL
jgi:acyl-CoA synthetase (AMP-forming)/AMP-acid ligase II